MEGYKHFIRLDEQGNIVKRFSDAFEQPQPGDICVAENAGRHYNDPIHNEREQFVFKWNGTEEVPRSQAELDAEWEARPPAPPSEIDVLGQQLAQKEIELMQLQADNNMLGQRVVDLEIRMIAGGI